MQLCTVGLSRQAAAASMPLRVADKRSTNEMLHADYLRARYQIYVLEKAGHSQTKIAKLLGVHKATISHE